MRYPARLTWFALAVIAGLTPTLAQANATLDAAEPKAVQVLREASRSDNALLRMNAVEAARTMPDRALPMVSLAYEDPNPAVRFAALVTAARLGLDSLGTKAQSMSRDETQPSYVRAAAALAAHRNGKDADLGLIAQLLFDDDPRRRSNGALLMGLTEEPAVIPVLYDAASDPMARREPLERALLRLQIAEALLNLGEEDSLKAIRGAAYSKDGEVQVLAVLMLGRALDRGMQGNLIGFLAKNPVELRLAAAEGLARMGSTEGRPVMIEAAQSPQATVRAQAAFALGQLAFDPEVGPVLVGLLDDPDPAVQIAAAAAVLEARPD
jgi:HEAT repeat protein